MVVDPYDPYPDPPLPVAKRAIRAGQRAIQRLGYEIGRPGGKYLPVGLRRRALDALELTPGPGGGSYFVDLDRVCTFAGFGYRMEGWHPYRAALCELLESGEVRYRGSALDRYHRSFCPVTIAQLVRGPGADAPAPLSGLPAWLVSQVWTIRAHDVARWKAVTDRGSVPEAQNNEHVGPLTERYGTAKLRKLLRSYHSIQRTGYRPLDFESGIVEGIFLIDGTSYVFIPTEGQHRLAALDALGIRNVLVRPRPGGPTVDRGALSPWTLARGGPYAEAVADELFSFYKHASGDEQKRRWGLGP